MEHQEQEFYAPRENKQDRYDKRLILKIVKEVENGLPRKQAFRFCIVFNNEPILIRHYLSLFCKKPL